MYLLELKGRNNSIVIVTRRTKEGENTCDKCEFHKYSTCVVAEMEKDYPDIYDAVHENNHEYINMNCNLCIYLDIVTYRYVGRPIYVTRGGLSLYLSYYMYRNLHTVS